MRFRLFALTALAATAVASCTPTEPAGPSDPATESFAPNLNVDIASMVKVDKNLYYKDINVGTGTPAAAFNKTVTVTYTGYLKDGTLFDSNVGQDSLVVVLNDVNLIAGWVLGIDGMRPGGIRKLVIGSSYGYGGREQSATGKPTIPANSTLVFDVHLKAVK
jgi:FKBP-type peptidyl-prolyl cis-trans isomerase FkpA